MKNIQVNLTFQSNTQQAKAAIKDLSASLTNLQNQGLQKMQFGQGLTTEMQQATTAANQLKAAMAAATNSQTGQVNMVKMNQILKQSGISMSQLREQLIQGGQAGVQAFTDLNNAILKAQVPMRRTQTMIDKMWTTLGNTVRWQISAQAIQAVTSGISEAFTYAQDLNKSLNNIRIVTGASAVEMTDFAKQANIAAKALSTSTKNYTDAALIYFQQGLSGNAVTERTNTTIKLANVVGESAETVSEWMTSIWNNFDDGSKSLEYYADVLAALGAATASSADEIATGLEKFSAIAETVGLSYEYATSALTTVTAETRQSADVVGTAFKTMFARIQDLELGNALDDGTTLGQYSQVLKQVGVEVKTAGGNLREMDDILNDLGSRWKSLTNAEQVAVAQGVAGIRQYNQMLALMDNWDVFQNNLKTAELSSGVLQAQQDVYAEGWEATKNRVTASAEAIYDALLNDEFFIELNNGLADALEGFTSLLEAMGGLKGLLPLLIAGISQIFGPKIINSLRIFSSDFNSTGAEAIKQLQEMQQEATKAQQKIADLAHASTEQVNLNSTMRNQAQLDQQVIELQNQGKLNPQAQGQIDFIRNQYAQVAQASLVAGKQVDFTGQAVLQQDNLTNQVKSVFGDGVSLDNVMDNTEKLSTSQQTLKNEILAVEGALNKQGMTLRENGKEIQDNDGKTTKLINVKQANAEAINQNELALEKEKEAFGQAKIAIDSYKNTLDMAGNVNKMVTGISSGVFALNSLVSAWKTLNDTSLSGPEKFLQIMMSLSMTLPMVITALKNLRDAHALETTGALLSSAADKKIEKEKEIHAQREKKRSAEKKKNKMNEAAASQVAANAEKKESSANVESMATDMAESQSSKISAQSDLEQSRASNAAKVANDAESQSNLKAAATDIIEGTTRKGNKTRSFTDTQGQTWREITSNKTGGKSYQIKGKKGWQFTDSNKGAQAFGDVDKGLEGTKETLEDNTGKFKDLGNKFKDLGNSVIKFAKAFGPAIVLAGTAVAVGYALYKAYNKADEAFKESQEATENLKKAYSATIEETQALKQSIDSFKEKQDAMAGLVKGTLEYKEALLAANAEANKLIEENDLIFGQDYTISDGQIVISEDSLDKTYEKQLDEQEQAANRAALSQITTNQLQEEADEVAIARKLNTNDGLEKTGWGVGTAVVAALGTAAIIAATGGLAAAFAPALIAGAAAAGGLTGALTLGGESDRERELLDTLQKAAEEDPSILSDETRFTEYLQFNTDATQDEIDELVANRVSIQSLIESNLELKATNEALYKQLGGTIANNIGNTEEEQAAFASGAGEIAKNLSNTEGWENFYNNIRKHDKGLESAFKIFELGDLDTKSSDKAVLDGEDISQTAAAQKLLAVVKEGMLTDPEGTIKKLGEIDTRGSSFDSLLSNAGISSEAYKTSLTEYEERARGILNELKNLESDTLDLSTDAMDNIIGSLESEKDFDIAGLISYDDAAELESKLSGITDSGLKAGLKKALDNFENDKKEITLKANIEYDHETAESEKLQTLLTDSGLDSKTVQTYFDNLQDEYNIGETLAENLGLVNLELKTYAKNMHEIYKEYSGVFDNQDKTSLEYAEGIGKMKTILDKMFVGLEADTEFVEKNLKNIKAYLEGDTAALKKLQLAAAEEIIITADISVDVEEQFTQLLKQFEGKNITIGTSLADLDVEGYIEELNEKIRAGSLDTEIAKSILEAMGIAVEVQTETVKTGFLNLQNKVVQTINASASSYIGTGIVDPSEDLETLDKEIERYHEINEVLEDIGNKLSLISKMKERAFGSSKISYIKEEIKALGEEIDALKNKMNEAQVYLSKDKTELNKYGAKYDENGRITNYDEILNAATSDEDFSKREKAISNYENSLNTIEQLAEQIYDKEWEKNVTKPLEEIDTKVQLKVEVEDAELKKLEFQLKRIQDQSYSAAEAITLLGQSATASMDKYDAGRQGIIDTIVQAGGTTEQAEAFISGDASAVEGLNLTQEHINQISNYQDMMIEGAQEANDSWKEMHQELDELWDEYNEDMDDAIGKLEHITSMMESYQNIIDLVGQEALGISDEVMAQFGQTMIETSQASVEAAKQSLEMNKGFLAEYQAALADAEARGDEDAIQLWTEKVDYAMKEVQADEEALMSATIASLETIAAERERLIDKAIEDFNQSMFGYDSMDEMQQAYEDQKKISELYLADYKKVYELSKLTRQVNESIDDTSSVKGKQALAKIQEKINQYQKDGVKMSEYELANLQREYELELAKIQLEEAQNAKSQVRLQRDSQGNWGYLYTADEEALNEAQQNYEDKVYNIIDANQKYVDETQQLIMKATADFEERMRDINLATFANEEERAAAIKKAQDDYQAQMQFYTSQLDIVLDNNDQLYTNSAEHTAGKFGEMQFSADSLTTHYSSTWIGNLEGVFGSSGTATGVYQQLIDKLGDPETKGTLLGDMASAQDKYIDWINNTFVTGGLIPALIGDSDSASATFSAFETNVKNYLGEDEKSGVRGAITQVKDDIDKLVGQATDTTDGFPAATKAVSDFEVNSKPKLNSMYNELAGADGKGGLNKALEDLYNWWNDIANAEDINKKINITTNYTTTGNESKLTTTGNESKLTTDQIKEMQTWYGTTADGIWGSNSTKTAQSIGEKLTGASATSLDTQQEAWDYYQSNLLTIKEYGRYNGEDFGTAVKLSNGQWYKTEGLSGLGDVGSVITAPQELAATSADIARVNTAPVIKVPDTGKVVDESGITNKWLLKNYFSLKEDDPVKINSMRTATKGNNKGSRYYSVTINGISGYVLESNLKEIIGTGHTAYFDTGGYTGEWGPEGRLAMLHQKEIVLNAQDTENLLTAIELVRSMENKLESNVLLAQQGLGSTVAAIAAATANQTLDQNVTIHAEFPNATNHTEIEEAFRNLTNLASQHANRY